MNNNNIECNCYDIPTGGCWNGVSVDKKCVGFEKCDHKTQVAEKPPIGKIKKVKV